MNTISTAFTRPRSSSGVDSGRIVCRRTTLTMSSPPPTARASSESHIIVREAEDDDRDAVEADDREQLPAGVPSDGPAREHDRRAQRPDSGSGSEHAEAGRPDVEHVLREHGQQRDRAAEQDGEEVERDRAEQHGRPAHEAHAAEHAREVGRRATDRVAPGAEEQRPDEGDGRQRRRNRVDELRVQREQQAADRRPDDHGRLEARPTAERAPARGSRAGRATASAPARQERRAPMRLRCRTRARRRAMSHRRRHG